MPDKPLNEPLLLRNRYRVVRRLGAGGGGTVYAVEDLRKRGAAQQLALKAHYSADNEQLLLEALQREFRILATLRHPSIARVYDFGRIPAGCELPGARGRGGFFFTRDLVHGQDLQRHCQELSAAEICWICARTAQVMDVLHRAGMVHGDFKPANVIISSDGEAHLIDFGLVHTEGQHGTGSGTMAYVAPETLAEQPVDRRIDLYALGITVFQLLTGRLPLPDANLAQLVMWHMDGDPLRVSEHRDLPAAVDRVVHRLTERDPDRRYPTAAEAALALAEAAQACGATHRGATSQAQQFVQPAPGENLAEPLARLEAAVGRRVLRGAGGPALISVEGEPGSGKTTLLQELAWRCQLAGVEVLRAEFHPTDRRALGLWTDLLNQVSGVVGQAHPLGQPAAGGAERYALYQQLVEFLERSAARTPLLLLLDDAQEADEESLDALRFLAHSLDARAPVMAVVAHQEREELAGSLGAPQRVQLAPLSMQDVARMAADASGMRDRDLANAALIHEHTGGNPLFVMEVLRRLSQHGWPATPDLGRLAPPSGLEQMYTARWRELLPGEDQVLEALAVLGRPASEELLAEVIRRAGGGAASGQGELPLDQLEARGWLDRNSDGLLVFRQRPAARVVYQQLAAERRQALHSAAAVVLDRQGSAEAVERTRHALGAEDQQLAEQSLDQALTTLQGLGAHRTAIGLCREMLARQRFSLEPARRRQLRRTMGDLLRRSGDFEQALEELQGACQGARGSELLRARVALARGYRVAGQVDQALELAQRAAQETADAADRVALLSETAAARAAQDRHEQVVQLLEQALEALDQAEQRAGQPDPATRAGLAGQLGYSLAFLDHHQQAAQRFEQALEHARGAADRRVEADILSFWAAAAVRQGDYSKAAELYDQMLEHARQTRDMARVAAIQGNLGTSHAWRGELAQALEPMSESLRLFEAMGSAHNVARSRCSLGQLQLQLGLDEQARASLTTAVQEAQRAGLRSIEAASTALLALAQARRGRLDQARQGIATATEIYHELGMTRDRADAMLDLAGVELDAGQLEQAHAALQRATEETDLQQAVDLQIRAAALAARLAARSTSIEWRQQAAAALEQAARDADRLGLLQLCWECHLAGMELADSLGQPGDGTQHALLGAQVLEQMARALPQEIQAAFWQEPQRRDARQRAELQRSVTVSSEPSQEQPAMKIKDPAAVGGPVDPQVGADGAVPEAFQQTLFVPSSHRATDPRAGAAEERFYRLLEIYRKINSELDPERLLGLVMDTAVELTGAERGFLLLGSGPDDLKVEVARNLEMEGEKAAYSRSIAQRVLGSGQPVITVSAVNDPRFKEYLSVHQMQLESVLCIPIHAQERVAGVLYMESRFQSGRFTPADQRLLMAFGDQVAIALTNARLLADNIRKADELQLAKQEIEALAEERGRMLNQRTEQLAEARRDLAETRRKLESRTGMFGMVGRSGPMLKLFHLVERVAATDVPVLVEGESGTGKEMVARAIHGASERCKKRLVSVNCAAIPEGLLESELFGHVRGAFTGADRDRKGLFAAAHGGTLFLDEIGDMPMRMQVDLLRAVQEKTIRPVGGHKDIQVDVRIIAASNKPLAVLVPQGKFREDLYYRLNVVALRLPPLRERAEDIPLLADHFLTNIAGQMKGTKKKLTRQATHRLGEYNWPGNVRQLEHALLNAVVLADSDLLDAEDFTLEAPQAHAPQPLAAAPIPASGVDRLAREKQRILEALETCGWNKSEAARHLGMPRRTFYRRLKTFGIS